MTFTHFDSLDNDIFLDWFFKHKGHYIAIEMSGEIFGERYGESPQLVRKYEFIAPNILKMFFNTTETLLITNPLSFKIGHNNELIIEKAEQVTFGWHYYGRPQTPDNWCSYTYILRNSKFVERTYFGPTLGRVPSYRTYPLGDYYSLRLID